MAKTDLTVTGTIDANGRGVLTIQPRSRQTWVVSQVTPEAPTSGSTTGALRKNGALVSPFLATGDVIADAPPVLLHTGDRLTVEWTGATPGEPIAAYVIYDDGNPT